MMFISGSHFRPIAYTSYSPFGKVSQVRLMLCIYKQHNRCKAITVVEKLDIVLYSVTYDTLNCPKREFCDPFRCFVAVAFCWKSLQGCWLLVVSVTIAVNFLICLAFVNHFKFCILMILVLWKFSKKSKSF